MTLKVQTTIKETEAALVTVNDGIGALTHRMVDPVADAQRITISCQAELDAAVGLGKALKGIKKEIVELFRDSKTKANEAHKSVCSLEHTFTDPVDAAIARLRDIVGTWNKAIRLEKERVLRLAAAAAAAEREAELEKLRVEKLAKAAEFEDKGLTRAAEAVLEAAETVTLPETRPAVYEPEAGKTADMGTSHTRKVYSANVTDLESLLTFVIATGRHNLVTVVDSQLRKLAKEFHESGRKIPGTEIEVNDVPVFK